MKRREMAMRAKEMLDAGTEPRDVAAAVGYKTVSGMLGAISLYDKRAGMAQEARNAAQDAPRQPKAQEDIRDVRTAERGAGRAQEDETRPLCASETQLMRLGPIALVKSYHRKAYIVVNGNWGDELLRIPFGHRDKADTLRIALDCIVHNMRHFEDRAVQQREGEA